MQQGKKSMQHKNSSAFSCLSSKFRACMLLSCILADIKQYFHLRPLLCCLKVVCFSWTLVYYRLQFVCVCTVSDAKVLLRKIIKIPWSISCLNLSRIIMGPTLYPVNNQNKQQYISIWNFNKQNHFPNLWPFARVSLVNNWLFRTLAHR